jgi:hypothetical protein
MGSEEDRSRDSVGSEALRGGLSAMRRGSSQAIRSLEGIHGDSRKGGGTSLSKRPAGTSVINDQRWSAAMACGWRANQRRQTNRTNGGSDNSGIEDSLTLHQNSK